MSQSFKKIIIINIFIIIIVIIITQVFWKLPSSQRNFESRYSSSRYVLWFFRLHDLTLNKTSPPESMMDSRKSLYSHGQNILRLLMFYQIFL